jgi:phosphotransferase system enzyme I (PtsI)
MLLIGLGLRSFSVTPSAIPEIKRVCRSVSTEQCVRVAEHTLKLESARDVKTYLKEELSRVFPELPL